MSDQGTSERRFQDRVIRVFVSSTFKDMHAEREELIKRVFPQLRKLCDQRGVVWGEVDLRWGVTEEQKAEGKVLPICLEEIKRCRPYFIGLLGERYGWVPDEIPKDLIDREPWLKDHLDHSVTELEILHGVLNNPEMADHAFFYFRDLAYLQSLTAKERLDFTAESAEQAEKLTELKRRVKNSRFPVEENYPDPKTLGELVRRDLEAVINRLYPEEEKADPLDRDAADHEVFARSRAGVYISRQEYFDRLDEHVRGDGPPLVVLGESGGGKSALLSNWALEYRERHPEEHLIIHFIGATPYSSDWALMLRRIMGEFKRRFGIEGEIPDMPDELRPAFANWLHMVSARGRVILILDALNQLEERDGAADLLWLPPVIPENVRLILSTLSGKPLEELKGRQWPTVTLKPLNPAERRVLIQEYLGQYTKTLSTDQAERIAEAEQSANPLYLKALLEELRVYGDHFTIDKRIAHYLGAPTIAELYERILERYEADYEPEREGLVGDVMSLLWAARRGLSEGELLEMLGKEGEPLPAAVWSPLYLTAEPSLMIRSGLIGFFHDYLRQAVRERYLPTEQEQKKAHLRVAGYFQERETDSRRVDELPWQLGEAGEWQGLYELLTDLPFFSAAWQADKFEVQGYWTRIEGASGLRMVEGYRKVVEDPSRHQAYVWDIAILLDVTGHSGEALELRSYLVEHYREAGDRDMLAGALGAQAIIFHARGELDRAMELYKEQERIGRELGNKNDLSFSLGNQANIFYSRGELDRAMELHKEEERICQELGNKDSLSISLGNQAIIFYVRGELDRAMELHKEEERICRELGNKGSLSISLLNQANIFHDREELDRAMELYKEQERICRELGDKYGLQASLGNQALILKARGELDRAMELYKERERICRELGINDSLAISLVNQANLLSDKLARHGEALPLAEEAYRLASTHGLAKFVSQIEPVLETIRERVRQGEQKIE